MTFKIRWSGLGASIMSVTYPPWMQKHLATVGKASGSGVIDNIASTSDGVISPSETDASNGGIKVCALRRLNNFDFFLSLTVLVIPKWARDVVASMFSGRAQRSENNLAPVSFFA